jgi:putative NIF3 family GTP cyclohydrolase 1 type 2
MPSNGDWDQMQKLVVETLKQHGTKLDRLHTDLDACKVQMAIINDRADRELAAAKSVAVKWGSWVGAIVSAIISAVYAMFRSTP